MIDEAKEIALKFIKSREMREYLRDSDIDTWADNYCHIISRASAPLEEKVAALSSLAGKFTPEKEWQSPDKLAAIGQVAIEEMTKFCPPGTIFQLTHCIRVWDNRIIETIKLFDSFDAAVSWLCERDQMPLAEYIDKCDRAWAYITKCLPSDGGEMRAVFEWTLGALGDVWFFDTFRGADDEIRKRFEHAHMFTPDDYCIELNLPVPFQVGDIVTIDLQPFIEIFHGVVVKNREDLDCCGVQIIYVHSNGNIDTTALKHCGTITFGYTPLSTLERAESFSGKLPENEAPLQIISEALKHNPALGNEWLEYIGTTYNIERLIAHSSYGDIRHFHPDEKARDWGVQWEKFRRDNGV